MGTSASLGISAAIVDETTIAWIAALVAWIAAINWGTWNWWAWLALHNGVRNALFDWDIDSLGDILGVGLSSDNFEMWHLSGHWFLNHGSNWDHYEILFGGVGGSGSIWFMARNAIGERLWDHFRHHFGLGYWYHSLWNNQWWTYWSAYWSTYWSTYWSALSWAAAAS